MEFSPMIRQYLDIKKAHEDDLVFFRLGDFYELFFEDAVVASDVLGLALTSRDSGKGKIPMCGMPHHAGMDYIEKLVSAGFRVALCEQTDEKMDGLAARRVVRTFTAGTVFGDAPGNSYIMAICVTKTGLSMAYCDISSGDFFGAEFDSFDALSDEFTKIAPVELIVCPAFAEKYSIEITFRTHLFGTNAPEMLLDYISKAGLADVSHIRPLKSYNTKDFMYLDRYVRRSLELFEAQADRGRKGSLLAVLDSTKTAMGGRLLHKWLEQPLISSKKINIRLEAVEELKNNDALRTEARTILAKIGDLERFCAKVALCKISGRDLLVFARSIEAVQALLKVSSALNSRLLSYFANESDNLQDILKSVQGVILDTATNEISEGGIFTDGYDAALDAARKLSCELESKLEEYVRKQVDTTGIKSLKISQNRVHGYYIEVPNSARSKVPGHYLPRQSLVGRQRFSTEELKQLESRILINQDEMNAIEFTLFMKLRDEIAAQIRRIQTTAHAIAHFDALQSLAEVAVKNGYVRPVFSETGQLDVVCGRHPVLEQVVDGFVSNDLKLNDDDLKIALITGPNMAGKSTFMRQTALICIMAQMGSFVPANSAKLPLLDAIFSRVGAADDLAGGQSTFMVEMTELAHILSLATSKSLILLDEVGRGTGTTDGLSIAMATIEHISKNIGAKCLFATHYHELTVAEGWVSGLLNLSMEVEKAASGIKFLHKIAQGGTNKSYGIFVAEMAGLPEELVKRSGEIHQKVMMQGYFDENILHQPEVIDYRGIRERARRYRLFLEEYSDIIGDYDE